MDLGSRSIRLNSVGRHECGPSWRLGPRRTRRWPDLDLWLLISGRGGVQTPDGDHVLGPGCCLLMRGGEDYRFVPSATQPFVHYWAHFDVLDRRGRATPPRRLDLPPRFRRLASLRPIADLFDRVVEARRDATAPPDRAAAWFKTVLLELQRHDTSAHHAARAPHHAELQAMRDRILADPGAEHRVDALAGELGVDPSYFCRLFRDRFGMPPRRFVTAARMDTARYLLRDTALPIGRIATMLGYGDVHFFSRHFRRCHGAAPSDYRRGVDAG